MLRHANELGDTVAPVLHRLGAIVKDVSADSAALDDTGAVDVLADYCERWQVVIRSRSVCHECVCVASTGDGEARKDGTAPSNHSQLLMPAGQ